MSDPVVLGIDPGGRETGLVVRFRDRCYGAEVVEGDAVNDLPAVIGAIQRFAMDIPGDGDFMVAAEAVTAPTGFSKGERHPINPAVLIGTSMVLGAVIATWPGTIIVPPGGHGSSPLRFYPKDLIGPREGPAGAGRMRHCRSAWDIAGAARRLSNLYRRAGVR